MTPLRPSTADRPRADSVASGEAEGENGLMVGCRRQVQTTRRLAPGRGPPSRPSATQRPDDRESPHTPGGTPARGASRPARTPGHSRTRRRAACRRAAEDDAAHRAAEPDQPRDRRRRRRAETDRPAGSSPASTTTAARKNAMLNSTIAQPTGTCVTKNDPRHHRGAQAERDLARAVRATPAASSQLENQPPAGTRRPAAA